MPNIKSAKKRVLVTAVKTQQNRMAKSALKTAVKNYNAVCESGDQVKAAEEYKAVAAKIDQAAAKGVIHKNNAAHKKSAAALRLNKVGA